ncbi:protein of unknown function [endosymbiont DhMRE of Dentiscutata heterogama]|uniref:hypothetical protein n=1 Tax=endosymbiont DhMRE of Dentiscutata heterogama TaxID=1609546 RepID=UPI000629D62F|nr:hypothetical protein [endosymbiont DhMRE of Dentiscutata heterogama]CFW93414.1 protein of unknown function [endosymbiont DhMRE of Dentiscutata heterogama]
MKKPSKKQELINDKSEEVEIELPEEELPDIDIDEEPEMPLWKCGNCGEEHRDGADHKCNELPDPYGCETIYCEPTCPTCYKDEGKCNGECDKPTRTRGNRGLWTIGREGLWLRKRGIKIVI